MKYVYEKHGSLYYVRRKNGKPKWMWLCEVGTPEEEVERLVQQMEWRGRNTLLEVFEDYKKHALPELALITQRDYLRIIDMVLIKTFGHMRPDDLTPRDVAMYLEKRKREGAASAGNKERAVLSSAINHGMRLGLVRINPCYGVRRNRERPKTAYVEDESLRLAMRVANPGLRHIMWAAYLTGLRQKDLRDLTEDNITPDGLIVEQSKDGKKIVILWSESLRKVVRRAMARSRCSHIFTNERGHKISREGISSAMGRLKTQAGIEWTFHDLRAKAESDHKTGLGLMTRYDRAKRLKAVR